MRPILILALLVMLPGCKVAPNATDFIQFGTGGCGQAKDACGLAPCVEASSIEEPQDAHSTMCPEIYQVGQSCWPLLRCERQSSGQCGFTESPQYKSCVEEERRRLGM